MKGLISWIHRLLVSVFVVLLCSFTVNDSDSSQFPVFDGKVIAFPDAVGYGRNAIGARHGGQVYHVTNLNDSGEGSFREAVSRPNRVIVFDVAGVIHAKGTISLQKNLTILGQTAPGDGVTIYGARVSASNADNTIVRYLRIRLGADYKGQDDACGIANGNNIIFDHCSISWGKDENFSVSGNGKTPNQPANITIQNSIIAQGLQNHSCGGLIQTGDKEGVTLYRNLYIDNKTRNPKVKGLNQFVNNVVYNWGSGAAYNMGGGSGRASYALIEDNYFIVGPGNNWMRGKDGNTIHNTERPARPFIGGNENFHASMKGNIYDNNKDGQLNGVEITVDNWTQYCSGTPVFQSDKKRFPTIKGQTSAADAYTYIVARGGASLPARDEVDTYLVGELTSLGTKGTIIRLETDKAQFPIGGPGVLKGGNLPPDTDGDGMPDAFEDKFGLDKKNPADAVKLAANGYMNIENFAFSIEKEELYR